MVTDRYKTLNKIHSQLKQADYIMSVGVRVRNEIKAIDLFWQSLAKQTYFKNLEIVFLDSGSTDGTIEYLKSINCNVYTIENKEFQFGDSCNLMMELTSCDHVIFFSGHVILESEKLIETVYEFIKKKGPLSGYFRQIPNPYLGCSIYDQVYLKYNFKKLPDSEPVLLKDRYSFSNAASIIARKHWDKVKFKNVIASEDHFWATEVAENFEGIYYFHTLNVLHSHNESYQDVNKRVRINAKARFPEAVSNYKLVYMYMKVFIALFLNTGKLIPSIKFAYAHASAYKK